MFGDLATGTFLARLSFDANLLSILCTELRLFIEREDERDTDLDAERGREAAFLAGVALAAAFLGAFLFPWPTPSEIWWRPAANVVKM
jgi:hypothetical protein